MDQMMQGKFVMDRWAREVGREASGGTQQQEPVDRQRRVLRLAHSLFRWAGQGRSSLAAWLEQHGELREQARAERVGQRSHQSTLKRPIGKRNNMNTRDRVHQARGRGRDQTRLRPRHLLFVITVGVVALGLPVAARADVAGQYGDGFGITWYADPGEWHEATVAGGAAARNAGAGDEGYLTAWFVDPGEWYEAPARAFAEAGKNRSRSDGYGSAWFVDPGEWYRAQDAPSVLASQDPAVIQADSTWLIDPGEICVQC